MKKTLILLAVGLFLSFELLAQANSGINTRQPTENLDVNSTLRVRSLPKDGTVSIYSKSDGSASASADQTYTAANPVVTDKDFGIVGQTTNAILVPLTKNIVNDDSPELFVIKRYHIDDWPNGQNKDTGFNTNMSTDKWEAMLSNVMYTFSVIDNIPDIFIENEYHAWEMKADAGGNWRVNGDIRGIKEGPTYVDVLFIKKTVVATQDRTSLNP